MISRVAAFRRGMTAFFRVYTFFSEFEQLAAADDEETKKFNNNQLEFSH